MRHAIYRGTGPISVLTPTGGINLAEGTAVDLDQVIGPDGLTVAAALGDHVALCTPVEAPTPSVARRRASAPHDETQGEE